METTWKEQGMSIKFSSTTEFRAVYDRQVSRVYKLALVMMGSRSDAEDIVQTVFMKAWEKKPHFRDEDHETAWFLTVTKNQCRDALKNYYRTHRTSQEEVPEHGMEFESRADNEVWQALLALEEKYRVLLYLYYYEGYTVREISTILRRRESTLQTQLAAGRKKLRAELEQVRGGNL